MEDSLWQDGISLFRPSYSSTFLNCAGSLRPSLNAPDNAGFDAAVGTVFHLLMSEWQTTGRQPDWLGREFAIDKQDGSETFKVVVDDEMLAEGQRCLDYVAPIPGRRFVETRVDISSITPIPDQGGTCDLAICEFGVLDATDWKYGRGVQVFAYKNSQLLCYVLGFFLAYDFLYDFQIIRLRIAQPRLNHWDLWEITRDELLEWAEWAKVRAFAAWQSGAPRTPSPKACQWCRVQTTCPALEGLRQALVDSAFEIIDRPQSEADMKTVVALNSPPPRRLTPPTELPTEQLARILGYRKLMEHWFNGVAEELTTRALHGEDMHGLWKIVEGRSRRRWRDEKLTIEKLSFLGVADDAMHDTKLKSPNQMKTVLKTFGVVTGKAQDEFLRELVEKPPGKLTLAPDGDNRAEIPSVVDLFEIDDEGGEL